MKTISSIIGISLAYHTHLLAQEAEIFRATSEENISKAIPADVRYHYSEFQTGNISFYNGTTSTAKFNYNALTGEMQFLDSKNDTLSLADEQTIKRIVIGKDLFYYDKRYGYLKVVEDYRPVQLAINQLIKTVTSEKESAYGQSSGVSSIKSINSYTTRNSQVQKLKQKGDILLTKRTTHYIIDQNNRCHRFNKSSILKVFADHKKTIRNFMAEETINFKKDEDLKKLLQFCNALLS